MRVHGTEAQTRTILRSVLTVAPPGQGMGARQVRGRLLTTSSRPVEARLTSSFGLMATSASTWITLCWTAAAGDDTLLTQPFPPQDMP